MVKLVVPHFNIRVAQPKAPDGNAFPFHILKMFGGGIARIHGDVRAVVKRAGIIQSMHRTSNLVTNAGDLYYAELGVAGTQPTDFTDAVSPYTFNGQMEIFKSVSAAPVKTAVRSDMTGKTDPTVGTTLKAIDSAYPKVNDLDTDNTGKGADVLTYKTSYTAGDWSDAASMDDVDITNPSPAAGENMLIWADGLGLLKSASDTAAVYFNHAFNG